MPQLTDRDFESAFYVRESPGFRTQSEIVGAQGLYLICPCGGHSLCLPFKNPRGARVEPASASWEMTGTSLADLTLTPSVRVGGLQMAECWHGFITLGEVITCQ